MRCLHGIRTHDFCGGGAMFHQLGYEATQLREGRFAGLQKGLDEISENIYEVRISPFEVT